MKLHHICIQTDNYIQSLDFYTRILNFKLVEETPDFHGRHYNSWLKYEDFYIELQTNKINEKLNHYDKNSNGIVHYCFYSEDIDYEYTRIKDLGFNKFLSKSEDDIYTVKNGRLFKIKAPEGTIIEIRDSLGI